jgi:hypothetical protein
VYELSLELLNFSLDWYGGGNRSNRSNDRASNESEMDTSNDEEALGGTKLAVESNCNGGEGGGLTRRGGPCTTKMQFVMAPESRSSLISLGLCTDPHSSQ